jgi:2-dehydro-3-deoxyphosphogluconate aldolase/(4S)-4-hydroxy-2-oxoglutarate aldolase
MNSEAEQRMVRCGIVPVVVLPGPAAAEPLAQALLEGGIDVIEITLRNEAALAGLERVARFVPEILPIAGTVLTPLQMHEVAAAGARMAVSPGFAEPVDEAAKAVALPWLPGVATASDCMRAVAAGRLFCKFFPAEQAGGLAMLKALGGPFPGLSFCPTGGVSAGNLANYLAHPAVRAAGGSWIAAPETVAAGDWAEITRRATAARALVETARLTH